MYAEPLIGRIDIILAVTQSADSGDRQAIEKTHEFSIADSILANPVRDDTQPAHAPTDFCNDQQIGNNPGRSVNIDIRWHDRHENRMSAPRKLGQIGRLQRSWRIDDKSLNMARHPHLETACHRRVMLAGGYAVDFRPFIGSILQPA